MKSRSYVLLSCWSVRQSKFLVTSLLLFCDYFLCYFQNCGNITFRVIFQWKETQQILMVTVECMNCWRRRIFSICHSLPLYFNWSFKVHYDYTLWSWNLRGTLTVLMHKPHSQAGLQHIYIYIVIRTPSELKLEIPLLFFFFQFFYFISFIFINAYCI